MFFMCLTKCGECTNDNIKITKTEKETKIIELQNYEFRIDIVVTNISKIISSKRLPSVDI